MTSQKTKRWLTGPQVCVRYGERSHVWMWRKDKTDPDWPKPMWLDGKKHYAEDQLDAYDALKMANPDAPLLFAKEMDLAASNSQQAAPQKAADGRWIVPPKIGGLKMRPPEKANGPVQGANVNANVNSPLVAADVDGDALLDGVRVFLERFVSYPHKHAVIAHTLWIAHPTLWTFGTARPDRLDVAGARIGKNASA